MRKALFAVALVVTASIPGPLSAQAWCAGTLTASWVDIAGNVFIQGSWHATHTQICNLSATWKEVKPEVCAAWLAKADAAMSLGRSVTVYYGSETSCAALPSYSSSPAPGYVMLN